MNPDRVNLRVVIRLPSGGGTRGGPFHATNPEAWFTCVPGLKVVAPATVHDAKGLIKAAIRDDNPVMFIEHKMLYGVEGYVPDEDYIIPFGVADVKREGSDVTVFCYGAMVPVCSKAADQAAEKGIECHIVDLRTLLPLDEEAVLEAAKKTGRVVVVHEAPVSGGLGAEIIATVM